MKKTFGELANIKVKETERWVCCSNPSIEITSVGLGIISENNSNISYNVIPWHCEFELQRKECTFFEAFKEYEKGIEIEFKETGYKYKRENGKDLYKTPSGKVWMAFDFFDIHEVRGVWYINE